MGVLCTSGVMSNNPMHAPAGSVRRLFFLVTRYPDLKLFICWYMVWNLAKHQRTVSIRPRVANRRTAKKGMQRAAWFSLWVMPCPRFSCRLVSVHPRWHGGDHALSSKSQSQLKRSSSTCRAGTHPGSQTVAHLTGSNFIGGKLSRESKDTYTALSPLGQFNLPTNFHNATESEIDAAVDSAAEAFPQYRQQSASVRAGFLRTIGNNITALGEKLIDRAHQETGLPLPRLRNERARTVDQLGKFANLIEEGSWVDSHAVVGSGVNIRRMQVGQRCVFKTSLQTLMDCLSVLMSPLSENPRYPS